MLNGKFYTGLPPKMIDRNNTGPNRQQSNFFWPDESESESVRDVQTKRRNNNLANKKDNYPIAEKSDVQTKQMFNNEFSKSSIHFNDVTPPVRQQKINEHKLDRNESNGNGNETTKRSSANSNASKIKFYDFDDDLNNVPRTDKNVKKDVERNTKNSPKLQDKRLTFDERGIKIIENDVKNIKIDVERRGSVEPKRILKKSESEYNVRDNSRRLRERDIFYEDERSTRRNGQDDNEQNYNDYDRDYDNRERAHNSSNSSRIVEVNYRDECDGEYNDYDHGRKPQNYPKSPLPRQRLRQPQQDRYDTNTRRPSDYVNERSRYNDNYPDRNNSPSPPPPTTSKNSLNRLTPTSFSPSSSQMKSQKFHDYAETISTRRNEYENNAKVISNSNDQYNHSKQQQWRSETPPRNHSPPQQTRHQPNRQQQQTQQQTQASSPSDTYNRSHKHLVSNIHFNDNQTSDNIPTTTAQRRNIRSSAVMRVSVGLPD